MHLAQDIVSEDVCSRKMASFTALNGSEPKSPEAPGGSLAAKRANSEERSSNQLPVPETKSGEVSTNQREHWAGRSTEGPSFQPASYPDVEGPHKRKRSKSPEPSRDHQNVREPQPESRDAYVTPQRERDYRPFGEEKRESHVLWYAQQGREDRAAYEQQNSAGSAHSQTDDQMGDALRRGTSHMESQHDYPATSPDGEDNSGMYGGSYTPDGHRDGSIQSDPKKRKRNFSNRTKTGCLTCRKRKKKCDETKPECKLPGASQFDSGQWLTVEIGTNCVRGGFICQGYPNQRGYQKLENKPSAVPLESKDPSYVPPGAYGMPQPQPSNYPNPQPSAPKRDPVPPYRGQPLRIDPPQGRPVLTDDDRPTASTIPTASVTSPDNKLSALSAYPANAFPTPISAVSSVQTNSLPTPLSSVDRPKEYPRVPPLHDLTRTDPETPHPGSLPQINILHPTRASSPMPQPPPPPPPPTTNPQVAAQLALSHPFPSGRQRTQKESMLQGREYFPFDRELMLERQRCSAACWRFNNSTNPNTGVSGVERSRLFREILNPTEPVNISPQMASPVTNVGRVGAEVVVEAPFTCDYGYNITIGNHVFIGRNCTVIDPMEIKIGNNCYIGPNVSLYGATLHTDPKRRQGSKSAHVGSPIIIDEDVWIGGNVIIMPGRKIGRGATIGAGSIVTRVSIIADVLLDRMYC